MDCYKCKYRGKVPGSRHSRCNYPGTKSDLFELFEEENALIAEKLNIRIDSHGYKNGWAYWPCDFDPVWINRCDGYAEREADAV